jgi:hypothetical protein
MSYTFKSQDDRIERKQRSTMKKINRKKSRAANRRSFSRRVKSGRYHSDYDFFEDSFDDGYDD